MILLAFASVYVWSIIFQKTILFFRIFKSINEFKEYVLEMPKLKMLIVEEKSMHSEVYDELLKLFLSGYMEEKKTEKINQIIENITQSWEAKLEKDLDYLGIIGSISPFIGLFGTVWGIMNSFQSIANSNSSSIAIVAPGISEALFATAIGLFVAIPAVIATSFFYSKIEFLIKDVKIFATTVILNKIDNLGSK